MSYLPYNSKLRLIARELRRNSTVSERLLWKKIRNKQVGGYEFHRQVPIDNYVVDFYCHELMLVIEVDGNSHDDKYEADRERQNILESKGISFLRFSDNEVKNNIDNVVKVISEKVTSPNPLQRGL